MIFYQVWSRPPHGERSINPSPERDYWTLAAQYAKSTGYLSSVALADVLSARADATVTMISGPEASSYYERFGFGAQLAPGDDCAFRVKPAERPGATVYAVAYGSAPRSASEDELERARR